jgi:AcrR family transcriptional regulator
VAELAPVPREATPETQDSREALLRALERLLEYRRLDELTVVELTEEAGVSRATFYVNFESKHAAVAARAERLMEQIYELWSPWLVGSKAGDRAALEELWMSSIALWRRHRALLMAAAEAWRSDASVSDHWVRQMQGYAGKVRDHIDAARAAGRASTQPDSAALATALVWLNESAMYLSFANAEGEPTDDRRLARALVLIWLRAIYDPLCERPCSPPSPAAAATIPVAAAGPRVARMRRTGNAKIRSAILQATAELLAERPLEEVTAVDVIERAGFSRPTFYTYFESKHAVVAALAEEVMGAIYDRRWRPSFESGDWDNPPGTVEHFASTLSDWRGQRAVLIAAARGWRAEPTMYRAWVDGMEHIVGAMVVYIEQARASGNAPQEPDARTLAVLLVWLTETILYLTLAELDVELVDDAHVATTLSAIWLRAIHGDIA